MATDSGNEIAKAINSFDCYSLKDQQSLLTVIEDYFTTPDESNEDIEDSIEGNWVCFYNKT